MAARRCRIRGLVMPHGPKLCQPRTKLERKHLGLHDSRFRNGHQPLRTQELEPALRPEPSEVLEAPWSPALSTARRCSRPRPAPCHRKHDCRASRRDTSEREPDCYPWRRGGARGSRCSHQDEPPALQAGPSHAGAHSRRPPQPALRAQTEPIVCSSMLCTTNLRLKPTL